MTKMIDCSGLLDYYLMPMVNLNHHSGSAYDFFVSLYVLHHPDEFGLRPSWAAGVRSRLPADQREVLDRARFLRVPLTWLDSLPLDHRNAQEMLVALAGLPASARLQALHLPFDPSPGLNEVLTGIAARGSWDAADLDAVRAAYARRHLVLGSEDLQALCAAWAQPAIFGDHYLRALNTYYQVFFKEEEERILPLLERGMEQARLLAGRLPVAETVEILSRGVQLPQLDELVELELVPSYWASPLIFFGRTGPGRAVFLYGVRSGPAGLVPGDAVPDGLVQILKALADPTRLRILRYLAQQPLTPGQLARRLRLRAPTVVHHLRELRLAGLVQVALQAEGEKRYALRRNAVDELHPLLDQFLSGSQNAADEDLAGQPGGEIE